MNLKYVAVFVGLILVLGSALFLVRSLRTGGGDQLHPAEVIDYFYTWYLDFDGNPLASEAYKDSIYLTDGFKDEVASTLASDEGVMYDPFLCAQDLPANINIQDPEISDSTARVTVEADYDGIGSFFTVEMVKVRNSWRIDKVVCPGYDVTDQDGAGGSTVFLYFNNDRMSPGGVENCGSVYAVEREVSFEMDPIDESLRLLFAGPTAEEQEEGYTSIFSQQSAGILNWVRTLHSTAYVNITDVRSVLPNANTSCGSEAFIAQVEQTVRQFGSVDRVIFAINENPALFYEWMQIGCTEDLCDPTPFL